MSEDESGNEEHARRGSATESSLEDRGAALIEIGRDTWASLSDDIRKDQILHLKTRYDRLLDEIYESADLCVTRNQSFSRQHRNWRRIVIVGTAVVAVANLLAAYKFSDHNLVASRPWPSAWLAALPLLAAILAAALAGLANWETLLNAQEQAQAYRESRELFLDAAREFLRRWDVYVRPLGFDPAACMNAAELYRQLIAKDQELRAKFKELTRTKK
jgi:hypothetical protein